MTHEFVGQKSGIKMDFFFQEMLNFLDIKNFFILLAANLFTNSRIKNKAIKDLTSHFFS